MVGGNTVGLSELAQGIVKKQATIERLKWEIEIDREKIDQELQNLFPHRARGKRGLHSREREVLALVKQRKSNKEIADALHISVRTVKFHVSNLEIFDQDGRSGLALLSDAAINVVREFGRDGRFEEHSLIGDHAEHILIDGRRRIR